MCLFQKYPQSHRTSAASLQPTQLYAVVDLRSMKPAAAKTQTVGRKFRKDLAVVRQQAAVGIIKWKHLIIELQRHED